VADDGPAVCVVSSLAQEWLRAPRPPRLLLSTLAPEASGLELTMSEAESDARTGAARQRAGR